MICMEDRQMQNDRYQYTLQQVRVSPVGIKTQLSVCISAKVKV